MITVSIENNFDSWRRTARILLADNTPPHDINWLSGSQSSLFPTELPTSNSKPVHKVDSHFIELARFIACHNSSEKWSLLYTLLFRLVNENRHLLEIESDEDVRRARLMAKAVTKDIHKFHALVRFRRTECDGKEIYFAWYEPHHFTVELSTPFFARRFGSMRFSILTPKGCAHWDLQRLSFSSGVEKTTVTDPDDTEDFWLAYYASIFNPFRLKIKAMKKELPVRHWKTLPEAVLIDSLIKEAINR